MGKHKLDDIIEGVMTGMHYDRGALKPIYDAYNAITLTEGCSAWTLRAGIVSRLMQNN